MLIFLDYIPVVAFIAAYALTSDFFIATGVIMVAMPMVLAAHWALTGKISRVHLISTALVLVLGAVTVAFRDALFLAWKPTVLNWLLAAACLISLFVGPAPLLKLLMGSAVTLDERRWQQLTIAWAVFFAVVGCVNLFVFFNFAEETWVYFKLWGMLGMTLVFVLLQGLWLAKVGAQPVEAQAADE